MSKHKTLRKITKFFGDGQKLGERIWNEELGENTTLLQAPARMLLGSDEKRGKQK